MNSDISDTFISDTFLVVAVELDGGTIFLSDRDMLVGTDQLWPCILQQSAINSQKVSLQIERQSLPDFVKSARWINREAAVFSISSNTGTAYDGVILLDGIIKNEPAESDGILSFTIQPPARHITTLPAYGEITSTEYPSAPDGSIGKLKPLIYGTVDNADLIPVQQPVYARLKSDAYLDDQQLQINDATSFSASGSIIVDGAVYSYTSKSGNALLGMNITAVHRAGTTVAQAGSAIYLAAGHAITGMNNILLDDEIDNAGAVDLNAATLTYPALPTVESIKARENIVAEFDQVDAANTATNTVNAIRAITATDSNIAATTGMPYSISTGAVEMSRTGEILFPAPSVDHIIKGSYSVTFTANANGNTGNAQISIGNQDVWVLDAGNVVYSNSPAVFFFDNDANSLPVSIQRDSTSGSIDLTITAATRTISLGNIDASAYALIPASSKKLVVKQTDSMPNRGRIVKASIAIEWFATDEKKGTANVLLDGVQLGKLEQNNLPGSTQTENITVDIVSQGNAQLLSSDIDKTFSGGTASISNTVSYFNQSLPIVYTPAQIASILWKVRLNIQAPENVDVNALHFIYFTELDGGPGAFGYDYISVHSDTVKQIQHNQNGGTFATTISVSSPGQIITILEDFIAGSVTQFNEAAKTASIRIAWVVKPLVQNNIPTFLSAAQSNRNLPNSGITTSHSGGGQNIIITQPAPPRTIINRFDLPRALVDQWPYFTNKTLEINYFSLYGEQIAVVRAVLLIDYDVIVNLPVAALSATITGKSGNPADVIAHLAAATGQSLDARSLDKLRTWATSNAYLFSRRIDRKTDALQLLEFARQQAMLQLADRAGVLHPLLWLAVDRYPVIIDEQGLLSPARIAWAQPVYIKVTLRYRFDQRNNFTRVIVADPATNQICKAALEAVKKPNEIELQAGFIRDDTTANQYMALYLQRYAVMRKTIDLQLPFSYDSIAAGDLIEYSDSRYRVIDISNDSGWVSLRAEELV